MGERPSGQGDGDWRVLSEFARESLAVPSRASQVEPLVDPPAEVLRAPSATVVNGPNQVVFRADPGTVRNCAVITIAGAALFSAAAIATGPPGYAAALGLIALAVTYVVLARRAPSDWLAIGPAGVAMPGRLVAWSDLGSVRITARTSRNWMDANAPLQLVLRDETIVTVPRTVLGKDLLGPWDPVIAAIRAHVPDLPVEVDQP